MSKQIHVSIAIYEYHIKYTKGVVAGVAYLYLRIRIMRTRVALTFRFVGLCYVAASVIKPVAKFDEFENNK